jgi:hypothetical protein
MGKQVEVTDSLNDGGDGLFSREDAHILSVLNQPIVGATGEVGEGLSWSNVRIVEQGLREGGNVGDDA